jgi:hypothetical protein
MFGVRVSVIGEVVVFWRRGRVFKVRTDVLKRPCYPLSSLLEGQNYYKYKENNLEKGRRTRGLTLNQNTNFSLEMKANSARMNLTLTGLLP